MYELKWSNIYLSKFIFNEEVFPFKTGFMSTSQVNQPSHDTVISWVNPPTDQISSTSYNTSDSQPCHQVIPEQPVTNTPNTNCPASPNISHPLSLEGSPSCEPCSIQRANGSDDEINTEPSTDQESGENETAIETDEADEIGVNMGHSMQTRSKSGIFKPKIRTYIAEKNSNLNGNSEPKTAAEALNSEDWTDAMKEEMKALEKNNTWTLVPFSNVYNLVGNKWVFKTKFNQDGSVQRLKARLVAKGFHQHPGVGFNETFSPVIKPTTIRIILTIAVDKGWDVRQLDINNAFLNGKLEENVSMLHLKGLKMKVNLTMCVS